MDTEARLDPQLLDSAATARQGEWQPIETAPKDGTDIIVGFDFATVWIVHVAWYRDGSEDSGCDGPEDIGWWSYTQHSVTQEMLTDQWTPTHWMPLPKPPVKW